MQTVQMTITPEQASLWLLEKNTRNRNLSIPNAHIYATDMKNGNWHKTHQGIAFYEDGVLADGQTRLKAITIANVPIEMTVTFGLSNDSSIGIDAHRMRSVPDQIAISGVANWIGKNEVAVAKMMLASHTKLAKSGKTTTSELVNFCESKKEQIVFACTYLSTATRFLTTAPVKCAVAVAFKYEDTELLKRFCSVLVTGVMGSATDLAAIRLRERLLQEGRAMQASADNRDMQTRLTERAIKAFCNQVELKKLVDPKEHIYHL